MSEAVEPGEGQVTRLCAPRPKRRGRRSHSGATMAEFALIAPIAFLLIMSIVVVGIVITNYIQLTNAAREGVRVAAICAGEVNSGLTPQLPDGATCSVANVDSYITSRLTSIPAITPSIQVCPANQSCLNAASDLSGCSTGEYLEVTMSYSQPLFLPIVSSFFETSSTGSRTLQSKAEAACE